MAGTRPSAASSAEGAQCSQEELKKPKRKRRGAVKIKKSASRSSGAVGSGSGDQYNTGFVVEEAAKK